MTVRLGEHALEADKRAKPSNLITVNRADPLARQLFIAIPFDRRYFLTDVDTDVTEVFWQNAGFTGEVLSNGETVSFSTLLMRGRNLSGLDVGSWTDTEVGRAWLAINNTAHFIFNGYLIQDSGTNTIVPMTVSIHARFDGDPNDEHSVFSMGQGNTFDIRYDDNTNDIRVFGLGPTLDGDLAGDVIADGRVHHIVVSLQPGNNQLWIDGRHEETGTGTTLNVAGTVDRTSIGARSNSAFFEGAYADLRVWNRAFSEDEIGELFDDPFRMYRTPRATAGFVAAAGAALIEIINEVEEIPEAVEQHLAMSRVVDEVEQIPDGVEAHLAMTRVVDEIVQIVEAVEQHLAMTRVVDEVEQIPEGVEAHLAMVRIVDEIEEIVETVAALLGIVQVVDETVEIVEAVLSLLGIVQVVDEVVEIVEAVEQHLSMTRVIDEVVELPETTVRARTMVRLVDEVVEIVETTVRARAMVRLVDEVVEIVEAAEQHLAMTRVVDEVEELVEAVEQHLGLVQVVDEVVELIEAVEQHLAMTRVVDEAVEILESTIRARAMTRAVDEVVEILEAVVRTALGDAGPVPNADVLLPTLNADVCLPALNVDVLLPALNVDVLLPDTSSDVIL